MEINTKKFKKGDIFIVIGSDLDDRSKYNSC